MGDRMLEAKPSGLLAIRFNGGADDWGLSLGGDLDLATAPLLERALRVCELQDDRPIVVDLQELNFMDIAGLRVLLEANERSRSGARGLTLVRGNPAIQRVLEVTQTEDRFTFASD